LLAALGLATALGLAADFEIAGFADDFDLVAGFLAVVLGFAAGCDFAVVAELLAGACFFPETTFSTTWVKTRLPATIAAATASFLMIFLTIPIAYSYWQVACLSSLPGKSGFSFSISAAVSDDMLLINRLA
jgi:hypothetical protein